VAETTKIKDDDRMPKGGVWKPTMALQKKSTHSAKKRSSTELRFASFPARLWSDLRGCQGSRWTPPFGGALDSPASHPGALMQHGRKQARFHGKTDKTGGYSRSTELPVVAPARSWRKIFCGKCGESHKEQETEGPDNPNATKKEIKQWRAATSALTFMTFW